MFLNNSIAQIGRRVRAAAVGGGAGSLNGTVHRTALRFDDAFEIVACVEPSNPAKALAQGAELDIPRPYGTPGMRSNFSGAMVKQKARSTD